MFVPGRVPEFGEFSQIVLQGSARGARSAGYFLSNGQQIVDAASLLFFSQLLEQSALAQIEHGQGEFLFLGAQGLGDIGRSQGGALGIDDDGPLDDVEQFADVAGPGMMGQQVDGAAGESIDLLVDALDRALEKMLGEQGDVFRVLAQRGDIDGEDVEAKIEILAEFPPGDQFLEVPIGGADDAHVHLQGAGSADPFEGLGVEGAQQLDLGGEWDIAHFVQEQGATVCRFETSWLLAVGAGEGAFFVAEEFAFQQGFGKGGAVDRYKRAVVAGAAGVDGPGDQFLAGARLAADEHGEIRAGHLLNGLVDPVHLRALADQVVVSVPFLQSLHLHLQALYPFQVILQILAMQGIVDGQPVVQNHVGCFQAAEPDVGLPRKGPGAGAGSGDLFPPLRGTLFDEAFDFYVVFRILDEGIATELEGTLDVQRGVEEERADISFQAEWPKAFFQLPGGSVLQADVELVVFFGSHFGGEQAGGENHVEDLGDQALHQQAEMPVVGYRGQGCGKQMQKADDFPVGSHFDAAAAPAHARTEERQTGVVFGELVEELDHVVKGEAAVFHEHVEFLGTAQGAQLFGQELAVGWVYPGQEADRGLRQAVGDQGALFRGGEGRDIGIEPAGLHGLAQAFQKCRVRRMG